VGYGPWGEVASVTDARGAGYFFRFSFDEETKESYCRITGSSGLVKEVWFDRVGDTKRVALGGKTVKRILKEENAYRVVDEQGRITRKELDERKNVVRVVHPDGREVSYAYEPVFNRRTEKTDERGILTRHSYDASGNLTETVEAANTDSPRTTRYGYDSDANLLFREETGDEKTAPALTRYAYDSWGNRVQEIDPEGGTVAYTHDVGGNVLTRTDALGNRHNFGYDLSGRLIEASDPLGNRKTFSYVAAGNLAKRIDPGGSEWTLSHDERGRPVEIGDPLGASTRYSYNPDGKRTEFQNARGNIFRYVYDPRGRLSRTVDGNGNEVLFHYDGSSGCGSCSFGADRPSRIVFPTFAREFEYDPRGRMTRERKVLSPDTIYEAVYAYDRAGNLVSATDREGKTTRYSYDVLGRPAEVLDAAGGIARYGFDARDNLLLFTDPAGKTTQFSYDRNNRPGKEVRPMGRETLYSWDPAGRLVRKVDPRGQKTEYGYDDGGRLVEIRSLETPGPPSPHKTVSFSYSPTGNLLGYEDGLTSGRFVYDAAYRKIGETLRYGSLELSASISRYPGGLKKSYTGPDGICYEYTYDGNNRVRSVEIPGEGTLLFESYLWLRPTRVRLPGGVLREYSYDPLLRLASTAVKTPSGQIVLGSRHEYDREDHLVLRETEDGLETYGYDDLYRLVWADHPVLGRREFGYDAAGNRTSDTRVPGPWSYNDNHELVSYGNVRQEYDAAGNLVRETRELPSGGSRVRGLGLRRRKPPPAGGKRGRGGPFLLPVRSFRPKAREGDLGGPRLLFLRR